MKNEKVFFGGIHLIIISPHTYVCMLPLLISIMVSPSSGFGKVYKSPGQSRYAIENEIGDAGDVIFSISSYRFASSIH